MLGQITFTSKTESEPEVKFNAPIFVKRTDTMQSDNDLLPTAKITGQMAIVYDDLLKNVSFYIACPADYLYGLLSSDSLLKKYADRFMPHQMFWCKIGSSSLFAYIENLQVINRDGLLMFEAISDELFRVNNATFILYYSGAHVDGATLNIDTKRG